MSEFNTVTEGGVTVSSNSETPEQLTAILSEGKTEPEKSDTSEAGAILGKEGGKAAAAKRAEAAKETAPAKEADGANAEPDKPAAEGEKPLGKPRDDPRARMLEATRQAAEAKREAQRERAERERLAAEIESLRSGKEKPAETPKAPQGDDPEPQEGDFAEYRDYVKAAARWEYRQAQKEAQKEAREHAYHAGISEAVDNFTKRMDEAGSKDPEYNSKVAHVAMELCPSFKAKKDGIPLGPIHVITDEIIISEHAPALTMYLAEHDDVFQRLKALRSPQEIQLAISKLEGRLEREAERSDAAPQAPALRAVPSQAKPPLRPVNGSPHAVDSEPGPDAPYEEHRRYWNAKDKAAARR